MGVVNRIFTTVSGLYNNINPITLSGVNDVIVVKGNDGELRCSPFQLRFSRLVFSTAKNQVHILVNGKLTDINMTITRQGDLFFEQEIVRDSTDYEKVVDYLQSKDVCVLSILQNALEQSKKLSSEEQDVMTKLRERNLRFRMFSKNYLKHENDNTYGGLIKQYSKFYYMLNSPENFAYLLKNHKKFHYTLESIMNNKPHRSHDKCSGPSLSYSVCMNVKVEGSIDSTFNDFQVKDIENPENTVVKIEGCCGQVFYISFMLLSRLYFELLISKSRGSKLVEFLENEHNKALGWSIFKSKKLLRRDVSFSLKLNSEELKSLGLNPGKNDVVFKIGGINRQLEGSIFLWNEDDMIVVSDVDGTITKSDVRGHLYSFVGRDWTHSGIACLYTKIVRNGYKILYLTSRPLGQSFLTKNYLKQVSQDSYTLPDGPVIHNPDGVFGAVYAEMVLRQPEKFKIECLMGIKELFNGKNPYLAGFGNRVTDVMTYKAMKITNNRIYTINEMGQIQAEYSKSMVGTYHTINEFIDSIFPPLNNSEEKFYDHRFSDFKWWRNPNK